jgi:hypothetical protein
MLTQGLGLFVRDEGTNRYAAARSEGSSQARAIDRWVKSEPQVPAVPDEGFVENSAYVPKPGLPMRIWLSLRSCGEAMGKLADRKRSDPPPRRDGGEGLDHERTPSELAMGDLEAA